MSTAQKQPDPYIGRSVLNGQFLVEQKIGSGGMGAVYRASQPAMNRLVAVKILHPKLTNRKDLVSRFRREARAMSHLSHPNTVKVFLYGELEDGSLYIVMEYLEGKNLNQLVRKEGPLPVERAVPVLTQVCGALQEAHSQGIIHRDLKPENIFICNSGGLKDYAKVLDFGLAKVTERELRPGSIMLTQEGMVFGTPEFMSPEQAQGKPLDARSDIYSLATILYEALTGKLPFDAKTPMEYIQLHVTKSPIPLDERVPGKRFPAGLGQVIAKALSKKTEERYGSAMEFAEALRVFAPHARFSEVMPQNRSVEPTQVDPPTVPNGRPNAAQQAAPIPAPAASQRGVHDPGRTLRMDALAGPAPAPLPPNLQHGASGGAGGSARGLGSSMAQSMAVTGGVMPQSMPNSHGYGAPSYQAPAKTLPGIGRGKLVVVALVFLVLGIGLAIGILYATESLG
jgi:eukaryotic-like serine/threonine-protein kinase